MEPDPSSSDWRPDPAESKESRQNHHIKPIFDELQDLQSAVKNENELNQMYGRLFEEEIKNQLTDKSKAYLSEHLRYRSDLEFFKYENEEQFCDTEIAKLTKVLQENENVDEAEAKAKASAAKADLERLKQEKSGLKKPQIRVLDDQLEKQFTPDGKRVLEQMFWYLWDNKDIQTLFVEDFFIRNCEMYLRKKDPQAATELIEMVMHDMFLEHTSKFPDWRVVQIQQ